MFSPGHFAEHADEDDVQDNGHEQSRNHAKRQGRQSVIMFLCGDMKCRLSRKKQSGFRLFLFFNMCCSPLTSSAVPLPNRISPHEARAQ